MFPAVPMTLTITPRPRSAIARCTDRPRSSRSIRKVPEDDPYRDTHATPRDQLPASRNRLAAHALHLGAPGHNRIYSDGLLRAAKSCMAVTSTR
jgi:hypothetical protein